MYALPTDTFADDERILLARVGFLRALMEDARVPVLFADIDRTAGLFAAADHLAPLATVLAQRLGMTHRSDLWLTEPAELARRIDRVPITVEYKALITDTMRVRKAAMDAYNTIDAPIVAARLEMFVRELRVPWRWLALELVQQYLALFWSQVYGRRIEQDRGLVIGVAAAPRAGEDFAAAYQRQAAALAAAAQRYLKAKRRSKTAGPKSDGQHLERYATWFYRHRVKGDSLGRIAADADTSRANVKRGIGVVEQLLDLPGERLRPPDK